METAHSLPDFHHINSLSYEVRVREGTKKGIPGALEAYLFLTVTCYFQKFVL